MTFTFQSHLAFAKQLWDTHLKGCTHPIILDATAGNGKDSLSIALLCHEFSKRASRESDFELHLFDIQQIAIENARKLLQENGFDTHCHYYCLSHNLIASVFEQNSFDLIVYNLGYLPGGNKALTTLSSSSKESIEQACRLLKPSGLMTIMLYPGHIEGAKEQSILIPFTFSLPKNKFHVTHHTFSTKANAPSLLVVQKTA